MNKIERFKIKEFIQEGEDDTTDWENGIVEMKKSISKLLPNKWNRDYYEVSLRTEERHIKIFGLDAVLIAFRPYGVELTEDVWEHKEQWCPYIKKPIEYWVKIGDKYWKWSVGTMWHKDRINPEQIEQSILIRTPEYNKARNKISKYAQKELRKIVEYLNENFPEPELSDVIRANTDPDYYY